VPLPEVVVRKDDGGEAEYEAEVVVCLIKRMKSGVMVELMEMIM